MNDQKRTAIIIATSTLIGIWFGYGLTHQFTRNQAIAQECAHYDMKTGEFKWGPVQ